MHEMEWVGEKDLSMYDMLAQEGRLGFMSLAEHSARLLKEKIIKFAWHTQEPMWERVPVEFFAPVSRCMVEADRSSLFLLPPFPRPPSYHPPPLAAHPA